jgi:hypothetical protein
MAAGPGGSLYLAIELTNPLARYPEAEVVKLSPSGQVLWTSRIFGNGLVKQAQAIAVDPKGNAYVTGSTDSSDMATPGAAFPTKGNFYTSFVRKLSPDGKILYSTYLGGTNGGTDTGTAIGVDARGRAFVAVDTGGSEFPVTQTGRQSPGSTYVAELNPAGTELVFGSYFGNPVVKLPAGGTIGDTPSSIAVDRQGSIYLAGTALRNFPTTAHAFQHSMKIPKFPSTQYNGSGFVLKARPSDGKLLYSTYLGGSLPDSVNALTVDAKDEVIVTGNAGSTDFPLSFPAQSKHGTRTCSEKNSTNAYTCYDGFLSVLDPTGSHLLESTFFGGALNERVWGITLTPSGDAVASGLTTSSVFPGARRVDMPASVPTCSNTQITAGRCWEAFVARMAHVVQ